MTKTTKLEVLITESDAELQVETTKDGETMRWKSVEWPLGPFKTPAVVARVVETALMNPEERKEYESFMQRVVERSRV